MVWRDRIVKSVAVRSGGAWRVADGDRPELDRARPIEAVTAAIRHPGLSWIQQVKADDLPHLHSLTVGLRRDLAAVTAGLTEDHNSGPVEGTSTASKRSSDRYAAGPPSNYSKSGSSSSHSDTPQDH